MTTTAVILAVASAVLLACTVRVYELICDEYRARIADLEGRVEAAVLFAQDSQVLVNEVFAEADAMRRHPAGKRPGLSLVQVMDA